MARTDFGVKFDGPALEEGHMPVRDLAPALLSLAEVFTEASVLLHPEDEPVALEIKATPRGSFNVELILQGVGLAWDQVSALATTDAATTLVVLRELVVGGGADTSLFGLLKWLRGRPVSREEDGPEPGEVTLTVDDDTSITVPLEVARLHRNIRVRKKVQEFVEPLNRDGVEVLEFNRNSETLVSLGEEDVEAFGMPDDDLIDMSEQEVETYLEIVNAAFRTDNKWRFSEGAGGQTFFALIVDDDFNRRIEGRTESFTSGDKLNCRMQIIQTQLPDGSLQVERRIVRVLKHIKAPKQLRLPGGETPELPE